MIGRARDRVAARLGRGEAGLTVVEVIVAGMILTVGSLGVLAMVDAATRNTFRVEQRQLLNNVLQREMEEIKRLPYGEIALTESPVAESGENNPDSRVEGTAFNTNRNGTGLKPLAYNGGSVNGETVEGGTVEPGPTPFAIEDVSGSIYRYVVWDNCPGTSCVDGEYLKRVVVVAKLDSTAPGGADRRYQEVQGQIVDPEAEPSENPGPAPGGGTATPWTLWLTDSTCERTEPQTVKEREEVSEGPEGEKSGDHAAHNTRGLCADGLKEGNEPGAPDMLWPEAPPLSEDTPVWDYATDVEPKTAPDFDKGLQVMKGSDCSEMPALEIRTTPDADGAKYKRLHKWVTPAVPAGVTDLALTGEGSLSLWTQSIEGGVYFARICVWLFVRESGADTALVQPLESLPYTAYSQASWPSSGWTEISVSLDLRDPEGALEIALPPGSRLGLALSVDDDTGNEAQTGIQTLYDEPSFDSRLSLSATGSLPEWP